MSQSPYKNEHILTKLDSFFRRHCSVKMLNGYGADSAPLKFSNELTDTEQRPAQSSQTSPHVTFSKKGTKKETVFDQENEEVPIENRHFRE